MIINRSESCGPLKFAGELNIGEAGALHRALLECIDGAQSVSVDLSGVTECDAAALQLFCAARKSAEARGTGFHVAPISRAVADACAAIGLSAEEIAAPGERGNGAV